MHVCVYYITNVCIVDCIVCLNMVNFHFTPSRSETMHVNLGLHLPLRRECQDFSQLAKACRS